MYIGVDIGGSGIRVAAADNLEQPDFSSSLLQTAVSGSFKQDLRFIEDAARTLAKGSLDAIGIGVTGDVDDQRTMIIRSVNNPYWNQQPVTGPLSEALQCPVFLANDANAGALGEAYYGGIGSDFAFVIWGTGIGGELVAYMDGKPAEVTDLSWDEYFQDWHYACSGSAIVNNYHGRADSLPAAERQAIFDTFVSYLKAFMQRTNVTQTILGGGVAAEFEPEFKKLSLGKLHCRVSKFGEQAGLYGGFAVVRHALDQDNKKSRQQPR